MQQLFLRKAYSEEYGSRDAQGGRNKGLGRGLLLEADRDVTLIEPFESTPHFL